MENNAAQKERGALGLLMAVAAACYDLIVDCDDERAGSLCERLEKLPALGAKMLPGTTVPQEPPQLAEPVTLEHAAFSLAFAVQQVVDVAKPPACAEDYGRRAQFAAQFADCVDEFSALMLKLQAAEKEEDVALGPDFTDEIVALAQAQEQLMEIVARIKPDSPDGKQILGTITRLVGAVDAIAETMPDMAAGEGKPLTPARPVRNLILVVDNS